MAENKEREQDMVTLKSLEQQQQGLEMQWRGIGTLAASIRKKWGIQKEEKGNPARLRITG